MALRKLRSIDKPEAMQDFATIGMTKNCLKLYKSGATEARRAEGAKKSFDFSLFKSSSFFGFYINVILPIYKYKNSLVWRLLFYMHEFL